MEQLLSDLDKLVIATSKRNDLVGYLTEFTPLELFHSSGFIPIRIASGEKGDFTWTEEIKPYVCHHVREISARRSSNFYNNLKGVILTYTCDAMCGLYNVWKEAENDTKTFFAMLSPPYNNDSDSLKYYRNHISHVISLIEEHYDYSFDFSNLPESIALYYDLRNTMQDFFARTKRFYSYASLIQVAILAQKSEPLEFTRIIKDFISRVPEDLPEHTSGVPILLAGTDILNHKIIKTIENSGAYVVADDLDSGERFFLGQISTEYSDLLFSRSMSSSDETSDESWLEKTKSLSVEKMLDSVLTFYLNRFPSSTRSFSNERLNYLLNKTARYGAKGIIFVTNKFCHPQLSDYPILSRELKARGIPVFLVEWEGEEEAGQLKTRVQAFIEIIQND